MFQYYITQCIQLSFKFNAATNKLFTLNHLKNNYYTYCSFLDRILINVVCIDLRIVLIIRYIHAYSDRSGSK